ncbi:kappa-casein [Orycteropus afer afer]|uniref:Kappa-casein n=1 Tax=Orycteropus afer afer TaxID=1230840 RepID=A0A8B6ZZ84_ORYAF|nr:kappa-casein [Orycteropus afer afer]
MDETPGNLLPLRLQAAEVQSQEQLTCLESDERWFCQQIVKYNPVNYMRSYAQYEPNYYQPRLAVPINNPYISHIYPGKPVAVRPHVQIPQWQVPSNINPSPLAYHTYFHPSLIVVPPKKVQDEAIIPTIDTTTIEPTHIPTIEPTVNTVVTPDASSDFISTSSTPATTTVPVTSPIV